MIFLLLQCASFEKLDWYFVATETVYHIPFIPPLVCLFLARSLGLLPAAIK